MSLQTSLIHSTAVEMLKPAVRATTGGAITSTWIDLRQYHGVVAIVFHACKSSAGTGVSLVGKIVESLTSGGTPNDYVDPQGVTAAFAAVDEVTDPGPLTIFVDSAATKGWIAFVGTPTGTSGSWIYGVSLRGNKKTFAPA